MVKLTINRQSELVAAVYAVSDVVELHEDGQWGVLEVFGFFLVVAGQLVCLVLIAMQKCLPAPPHGDVPCCRSLKRVSGR